jgi:hypothetical protein
MTNRGLGCGGASAVAGSPDLRRLALWGAVNFHTSYLALLFKNRVSCQTYRLKALIYRLETRFFWSC